MIAFAFLQHRRLHDVARLADELLDDEIRGQRSQVSLPDRTWRVHEAAAAIEAAAALGIASDAEAHALLALLDRLAATLARWWFQYLTLALESRAYVRCAT